MNNTPLGYGILRLEMQGGKNQKVKKVVVGLFVFEDGEAVRVPIPNNIRQLHGRRGKLTIVSRKRVMSVATGCIDFRNGDVRIFLQSPGDKVADNIEELSGVIGNLYYEVV